MLRKQMYASHLRVELLTNISSQPPNSRGGGRMKSTRIKFTKPIFPLLARSVRSRLAGKITRITWSPLQALFTPMTPNVASLPSSSAVVQLPDGGRDSLVASERSILRLDESIEVLSRLPPTPRCDHKSSCRHKTVRSAT